MTRLDRLTDSALILFSATATLFSYRSSSSLCSALKRSCTRLLLAAVKRQPFSRLFFGTLACRHKFKTGVLLPYFRQSFFFARPTTVPSRNDRLHRNSIMDAPPNNSVLSATVVISGCVTIALLGAFLVVRNEAQKR